MEEVIEDLREFEWFCASCGKMRKFVPTQSPSGYAVCIECYHKVDLEDIENEN